MHAQIVEHRPTKLKFCCRAGNRKKTKKKKHCADSQLRLHDNKFIQYEEAFLNESHLGLGYPTFRDVI
jgi:hypothetical protein